MQPVVIELADSRGANPETDAVVPLEHAGFIKSLPYAKVREYRDSAYQALLGGRPTKEVLAALTEAGWPEGTAAWFVSALRNRGENMTLILPPMNVQSASPKELQALRFQRVAYFVCGGLVIALASFLLPGQKLKVAGIVLGCGLSAYGVDILRRRRDW